MRRVLFIDRDGTILVEPADQQIDSFDKFAFVPGALTALARIAAETNFELVLVTNQDGLGTSSFPEPTFWPVQEAMLRILDSVGVRFADVHIDRTTEEQGAPTRKPGIAMLHRYTTGDYDLARSFVIGDRSTDVILAKNLGAQAIRLASEPDPDAALTTSDWQAIDRFLRELPLQAQVHRKTSETEVQIGMRIDSEGRADIHTGIDFLDHMLEQLARHSGCDLSVQVQGDLHIDEHHSVEDVALTLGMAFDEALGGRVGIERYGFVLPMDEAQAQIAIDFSGRPLLKWDVQFQRPMLGDLPTELVEHFARSFSTAARCTLHIQAVADNDHHLCESIFKSLGRCLRQATTQTEHAGIPSTKGVL